MSSFATAEHDPRPRATTAVQLLIAINVAIVFLQWTVLGAAVPKTLAFPGDFGDGSRWWTVFTYMFAHADVWQLAVNMYALWLFGPRLETLWGSKRFAGFYVLAGLGGLLFHALFIRHGALLGATAAVYGVLGAYAMQWPRDEVHLFGIMPLRTWTLVAAFVAFDLLQGMFGSGGDVAYLAHVGGFLVAWFYMRTPQGMTIDQLRQRMSQAPEPPTDEPPRAIPRTQPRARDRERLDPADEIVARSKAAVAKRPPTALVVRPRPVTNDEINRVLDKISAEGLDSLTAEEKRMLEEMSRKLKGRD